MKFDDVIEKTGALGWFQIYAFILVGCFGFWTYHGVAAPFVVFRLDHWCHVTELSNLSMEEQKYIGIPYDDDGEYQTCKRYFTRSSLYLIIL